jgi:hypothetical protein
MENAASTLETNMQQQPKELSRWAAAGLHLIASVIIAIIVIIAMLYIWYPSPYFQAMGGTGLLLLVTGVDVVIGPLITLIIFNTQKKSLKFDLLCVGIVQIAALAYGVSTMFQARPVYTVFNKDRFDVIIAVEPDPKELAKATDAAFKSLPLAGPQIVAMVEPSDKKETERILFSGINSRAFTQYYVPYEAKAKDAAAASQSIAQIRKTDVRYAESLKAYLVGKKLDENGVGFLPLYTRNEDMTMMLDGVSGKILAIVPISPVVP